MNPSLDELAATVEFWLPDEDAELARDGYAALDSLLTRAKEAQVRAAKAPGNPCVNDHASKGEDGEHGVAGVCQGCYYDALTRAKEAEALAHEDEHSRAYIHFAQRLTQAERDRDNLQSVMARNSETLESYAVRAHRAERDRDTQRAWAEDFKAQRDTYREALKPLYAVIEANGFLDPADVRMVRARQALQDVEAVRNLTMGEAEAENERLRGLLNDMPLEYGEPQFHERVRAALRAELQDVEASDGR